MTNKVNDKKAERILQLEDACMYALHTLRACERAHGSGRVPGEHSVLLGDLLVDALVELPVERWGKHEGLDAVFDMVKARSGQRGRLLRDHRAMNLLRESTGRKIKGYIEVPTSDGAAIEWCAEEGSEFLSDPADAIISALAEDAP